MMIDPRRDIPTERQYLYVLGWVVTGVGGLLFGSTFVSMALSFGDFSGPPPITTMALTSFGGVLLIGLGNFLRDVAARGVAGSGLILNPRRARQDLEPFSRMAGGMIHDVLDEARTEAKPSASTETVIKVRCRSCQALADEGARFCPQCGKPV